MTGFWDVVKSWYVYLARSMKHSACKGFEITTALTLTNTVIYFPLFGLSSPRGSLNWKLLYPYMRNQRPKVKPSDSRFIPYF